MTDNHIIGNLSDADALAQKIEHLRERAKDYKAQNVQYFLSQAFISLDHIRNLLTTFALAGFGLLSTGVVTNIYNIGRTLIASLIIGGLSYILHYFAQMYEADYYAKKERIYSEAFPSMERYKQMLEEEQKISKVDANTFRLCSFVTLIIQLAFLIYAAQLITESLVNS